MDTSKILSIINDDYAKMLEKEKEARSSSIKTLPITGIVLNSNVDNNKNGTKLVTKLRNFMDKKRNLLARTRLNKLTTFRNIKQKSSVSSPPKVKQAKESNNTGFAFSKELQWWNPPEENRSIPIDFCRDTSLHGLKYIGQSNRHISERIFWLVAFFCGLILAVILISDVWNKYNSSPIIVSFDPSQISVDKVPFPAVTVCNMNKVLKSQAEAYIRKAQSDDLIDSKIDVFYLDHICSATSSFTKQFNYSRNMYQSQAIKDIISSFDAKSLNLTKVNEFLRKAAQNCSDLVPLCVWQDQEYKNCSTLFRPIETEFGKCCVFNMIPQSELYKLRNDSRDDENEIKEWMEWNSALDKNGILLSEEYTGMFPRRQMEAGKSYGLSFALNPNIDEYFCTTSDSTGFRLATHWVTDVSHVTDFGISIQTKAEVFVRINPDITLADQTIFKFDKNVRQCYAAGEYNLQYFNYYTISNCIDECIANETFQKCFCKRYYMPRSDNQTLCGGNTTNFECAENVKLNMTRYGSKRECKQCLPSCSEVEYPSFVTTTPLQTGLWSFPNNEEQSSAYNENVTIVHVYMGMDSTYAKVRNELFGSTDLFANTGGLMGLCLGFSGLSLMELIYFFTLRAWWIQKRAAKRNEEIRKNIIRKLKSGWIKVKALRMFRINGQSVLDKQAEGQVHELEKVVVGSSLNRLHMSPIYTNNYMNNTDTTVQITNETNQVEKPTTSKTNSGKGLNNATEKTKVEYSRARKVMKKNAVSNNKNLMPTVSIDYRSALGDI